MESRSALGLLSLARITDLKTSVMVTAEFYCFRWSFSTRDSPPGAIPRQMVINNRIYVRTENSLLMAPSSKISTLRASIFLCWETILLGLLAVAWSSHAESRTEKLKVQICRS